jgi:exodeoxyribonuclease V beta subunit
MIESLDLTRHAVLEASAGTGKTHAIGQVVLRLLAEERCRLDNMLIVTFTEKATGELKGRLRRGLIAAIDHDPAKARLLQRELDQFDQAAILTIHGFCLRLLQNYAADLGQDFNVNFVSDEALRKEVLRDVQRKDWPTIFGDRLPAALRAARFDRDGAGEWEAMILDIVSRYRPECGHRLVPDPTTFLGRFAGSVPSDQPDDSRPGLDRSGGPSYGPSLDVAVLRDSLAVVTIDCVRRRLRDFKRERGAISFDDVIERVAIGLDPEHNPYAARVAAAIREQYRFAIVDEFQDTDALQWSIFRRLFLDEGESRLLVVGDPKQAIYGFRGADLPTYRDAVRGMVEKWNATSCPLAVNWRSGPDMIEALNRLFERGEFFPPDRISYVPVAAPPPLLQRSRLARDDSGRAAVSVVDINGDADTSAPKSRRAFAAFTAAEIRRLLTGAQGRPLIDIQTPAGSRPLTAADVCLLVFRRPEANDFTAALRREGIAYSFYKTGGLGRSHEADDVRRVLDALAHADQERFFVRAVLTAFFRVSPAEILASGGVPANHPARVLFGKWLALAERRQWSELFTSMLEETGILFREREDGMYERRLANLRFLLGRLQFAAYQQNLDLFELIDALDDAAEEKEADVQPQETDEPRVRIMTIHASKGLEFPIVFVAARFANEDPEDAPPYRDDAGRLVYDVPFFYGESPDQESLTRRVGEERLDELRRLYYVALTRPQFKLYLPFMNPKDRAKNAPLSILIAPALTRSELAQAEPLARLVDGMVQPSNLVGRVDDPSATIGTSHRPVLRNIAPLFPVFDPSISQRRSAVQSFTGMHRALKREQADAFGDRPERIDEVHEPIVTTNDPFRGAIFGEMVHEVFERVDFAEVASAVHERDLGTGTVGRSIDAAVAQFLPRLVTRVPDDTLTEQCRHLLRGMVWNGLRTPLRPLGGALADVRKDDCLQELEFLYPDAAPTGESRKYVTGFMDLVFRWRGAIYLLDWKTNVLPAYDAVGLETAMREAGYHLQISLYWEALSRWLGRTRPDNTRLGGVFYLFLRGLSGTDDSSGVYFVPANKVVVRTKRDG